MPSRKPTRHPAKRKPSRLAALEARLAAAEARIAQLEANVEWRTWPSTTDRTFPAIGPGVPRWPTMPEPHPDVVPTTPTMPPFEYPTGPSDPVPYPWPITCGALNSEAPKRPVILCAETPAHLRGTTSAAGTVAPGVRDQAT